MIVDAGLLRRRREFRWLFCAEAVTYLGTTMTRVALPFQVYDLTHSTLAVGLLGAVQVVPMVAIALWSGALADAADRRRLVVLAESGGAVVAALLLLNAALPDPALWPIYVLAAFASAFYGLLRPPLDALVPQVVARDELATAATLEVVMGGVVMAAGPALAGVLIGATDVRVPLAIDALTFVASALFLSRLDPHPPARPRRMQPVADVREGLSYARRRPVLLGTYLIDLNAMILGMPLALFPAIAPRLGGPEALGALYAAPAAGAAVVAILGGWTSGVHRQGRAIVLAVVGWGAAIVAFGFTDALVPALVMLAVAGAMDAISGVFRATIWNDTVPEELRGRLAGIEMISWGAGPGLGDFEAGLVASVTSVRASIVSGGVACIAGCGALVSALPELWRYAPSAVEDHSSGT